MKKNKILHLMHNEKFIAPFIEFVKEYCDFEEHFFIIMGGIHKNILQIPQYDNVLYLDNRYNSKWMFIRLNFIYLSYAQNAEKIILHSLKDRYFQFLFFNQKFLNKSFWVMWGYDLYCCNDYSSSFRKNIKFYIKKQVIKNMGHFITYIKGDYELAQKWYGAKGEYHECFMYPSNLYKEYDIKPKEHSTINIQLGNSADPTNNHIEVLQNLVSYKDENIKIFTPLSYGGEAYAKKVIVKGKELFGEKFIPLTEFMPFENYLEFLSEIDIAVFAHKRQQAMGNAITLLGLGKKVYVDSGTVQFDFFKKHDVVIFDVKAIDLQKLNQTIASENKEKMKYLFSKDVLLRGLQRLFND